MNPNYKLVVIMPKSALNRVRAFFFEVLFTTAVWFVDKESVTICQESELNDL